MSPDPLTFQILWDRLLAMVEEQARVLVRTAFCSTVREAEDLSFGLFDRQGRMVAQAATGTPGHVNAMADAGLPLQPPRLPDWDRIAREPWAQEVILGLAGLHAEAAARGALPALVAQSRALCLAAAPWPLRVRGWYFPVEIDPGWQPPPELPELLNQLPRPLWVSAYDSANLGPRALLTWIERWLPTHVGVLFQDGVGVHARVPSVARDYLRQLTARLGRARVQVIAEAFRPAPGGGFRSATAAEFLPQLEAYQDWPIFAFDGPHYLSAELVQDLVAAGVRPH